MTAPDTAHMEATLMTALRAVLPDAQALGSTVGGGLPEGAPVAVTLAVGPARWWLYAACGRALCASLLARMLGRAASAAELEEMGAEALAEFCNLLAGRVASLLGGQGVDVEIGIPRAAGMGAAPAGQRWLHEGHVLTLALQHAEQEPGT